MRYFEIIGETTLMENYQFIARTGHGDTSADALMADVSLPKALYKLGNTNRYRQEQVLVVANPDSLHPWDWAQGSLVIFDDGSMTIKQTYNGEIAPVAKYILNRWSDYADFVDDDTGMKLSDFAKESRLRPTDQKIWYHGTSSVHLPTISRLGLQPQDVEKRQYRGMEGSKEGLVYLTSDIETAKFHAQNSVKHFGGAPVVLNINIAGLEDLIRTDHDVKHTLLGRDSVNATDYRRIERTPGQGSYLTIQTIAFAGRIPGNRITVEWRGKESKASGRIIKNSEQYAFVNALGDAAQRLPKGNKDAFFEIINAMPSGSMGRRKIYPPTYYEDTKRLVNSVHASLTKLQPVKYASWVRGMYRRSGRWRTHYDTNYKAIAALITTERDRLMQSQSAT